MTHQSEITALLSDRLRVATRPTHESVDQTIMAAKPFESLTAYGRFLCVQHGIHRDVAPLYQTAALATLIPDLRCRQRLDTVEQDAADLGIDLPAYLDLPAMALDPEPTVPQALGWLYVVEGSNLGAAFLLKYAKKMGLSEKYGARHLSEAPEGRAPNWRSFKGALNRVALSEEDVSDAILGAQAAFARVHQLVRSHLG